MTALTWEQSRMAQLAPAALHALLSLRAEVFVVEQRCVFQDPDELDECSWHLLGREAGILVAYLRIVDAGRKYAEPAIGRVVTRPSHRGLGLGAVLVREGIVRARLLWPGCALRIGAQQRLEAFYRQLGFKTCGPVYIEDDIAHVEMLLTDQTSVFPSTTGN